jgi:hypothetical protein
LAAAPASRPTGSRTLTTPRFLACCGLEGRSPQFNLWRHQSR